MHRSNEGGSEQEDVVYTSLVLPDFRRHHPPLSKIGTCTTIPNNLGKDIIFHTANQFICFRWYPPHIFKLWTSNSTHTTRHNPGRRRFYDFLAMECYEHTIVSTNGKTVLPVILSTHQVRLYEGTMYRGDTMRLDIKLPPDPVSGIYGWFHTPPGRAPSSQFAIFSQFLPSVYYINLSIFGYYF